MSGFGNRKFLTKEEWETYMKRKPVRYIRRPKEKICSICELPESLDNPLQNCHVIGFDIGIKYFGLTPDYLDSPQNIVTAHRKQCNKKAELPLHKVYELVEPPDYILKYQ